MSTLDHTDAASFLQSHLASYDIESMQAHIEQICKLANSQDREASNALLADFTELYESGVFAFIGDSNRAAVNLTAMVADPFTDEASFDPEYFGKLMYCALRLLDNMGVDRQKPMLSINGLAETIMMMGYSYDSKEGRHVAASLMRFVRDEIFHAALRLTYERGSDPSFNVDKYLSTGYGKTLPSDFREDIHRYGLRFPTLMTIDNNSFVSICMLAGVTPGVMPPPEWKYHWTMFDAHNCIVQVESSNYLCQRFANHKGLLPPHCKTALDLKVEDYNLMVQKIKRFIDGGIKHIDFAVKANFYQKRPTNSKSKSSSFTVVSSEEKLSLVAIHRLFDCFGLASV